MKIWVPWSGGVDSTYLLMMLASEGHEVHAGYIELANNTSKTARELAAIDAIIEIGFLRDLRVSYEGVLAKHEILRLGAWEGRYSQPLIWLMGMLYASPDDADGIALGFVQNDDAISYLDEISAAYVAMAALYRGHSIPKLSFPLKKVSKQQAFVALPEKIRNLVTWCENHMEPDRCGECVSCKRMKYHGLFPDGPAKCNAVANPANPANEKEEIADNYAYRKKVLKALASGPKTGRYFSRSALRKLNVDVRKKVLSGMVDDGEIEAYEVQTGLYTVVWYRLRS